MTIIWNELKKILNWRMLIGLTLLNLVLFNLLLEFSITVFPNGRPALDDYRINLQMIEEYGTVISPEERQDFKDTYEEEVAKADQYIRENPEFQALGIDSYAAYREADYDQEELATLHSKVMFEEPVDLFWELQARRSTIEYHDDQEVIIDGMMEQLPYAKNTLLAVKERDNYGLMSDEAVDNYQWYSKNLAIVVMISVAFMLSPIILRDRSQQLIGLQYTTKTGRKVYVKKLISGLFATLLLTTALLIVYLGLYTQTKTGAFLPMPLEIFISQDSWYNITFFQYILLSIAAIYCLAIVAFLVAMSVSTIASHFVLLIGMQLPFYLLMIKFGVFYLVLRFTSLYLPQWIVPTAYAGLLLLGLSSVLFLWQRERKKDLLI